MKEPKCFQTFENPTLIDLMLANSRSSFQDSFAIGPDVSDFYKMVVVVIMTAFQNFNIETNLSQN